MSADTVEKDNSPGQEAQRGFRFLLLPQCVANNLNSILMGKSDSSRSRFIFFKQLFLSDSSESVLMHKAIKLNPGIKEGEEISLSWVPTMSELLFK